MPFPDDETIIKTAGALVEGFQAVFGKHPGFQPAHAKGFVLNGTFTPTPEAASLSIAYHFNAPSTPIVIRFSNSTGIPAIPDTDPKAEPRGIAIRFDYPNDANGRRVHTDLIMHSVPLFPTRTGAEILEYLHAIVASSQETEHPNSVEKFIGSHPATSAFLQAPKPVPTSFARQQYFCITAFTLVDATGKEAFVRYHATPEAGVETLTPEEAAAKGPNFLHEEMTARLKGGPAKFKLSVQIADESDVTDDAMVRWPESRKVVELGTIVIEAEDPESDATAKNLIFDPIPRVPGVGPSADPLLEMRAAIYLMSGKQRRAA